MTPCCINFLTLRRQEELEARLVEEETTKRVEELVAKRVQEELERRKDEIEREVLRRVEEAKKVGEAKGSSLTSQQLHMWLAGSRAVHITKKWGCRSIR